MPGKAEEPRPTDPRQELHEYIESLKGEWQDALELLHAEQQGEAYVREDRAE